MADKRREEDYAFKLGTYIRPDTSGLGHNKKL